MTRCTNLSMMSFAALLAFSGCFPEPGTDAGAADDSGVDEEDSDAGFLDEDDGGVTVDGGGEASCPPINPLSTPVGQVCSVECQECGADGCIAPGTGCIFIRCEEEEDGTLRWRRLTTEDPNSVCAEPSDGGPVDEDAGVAEEDAGTTDAGTTDAGTTDAGTTDAG